MDIFQKINSLFLLFFITFLLSPNLVNAKNATDYRQEGLAYRSQGNLPAAIASLSQAVNLAPGDSNNYVILGWTQHLAGENTTAAKTLWQAIWLKPQLVEAANALGIVYLVRGELSSAILTHQWAGYLKANNEIAYYNLSLAYQLEKEFALAIAYAKLAIKLEPQNPHPLVSLAISHWADSNPTEAKLAFQQAINLDARYRSSQFLDFLQEAGFSSGQIAQAKEILTSFMN